MTNKLPPFSPNSFTIYHNARCSNSRGALAILREHGIEPQIIDYIAEPLSVEQLETLIQKLGMPVRDVMRAKEDIYKTLKLDTETVTDAQLLEAIVAHPVLLNRPIVVHGQRALLCRPPEQVLQFLTN
ncbi:arsenate reductase (glutaredoxin) [Diaphorobacter sp. HDW4A]|nr:arsenate reductase (glutaredoxin) [Diaphorobacter sp. HDW4A]